MNPFSTTALQMFTFGGVFFAITIAIALLGERTLFLFDGDEAVAARVYKTLFASLAGFVAAGFGGGMFLKLGQLAHVFSQSVAQHNPSSGRILELGSQLANGAAPWVFIGLFVAGQIAAVFIWFENAPT